MKDYKKRFEEALYKEISSMREEGDLFAACEYALKNGGKRIRPILILLTSEALGKEAMDAALAIEFFHTASLIADDLPMMDDEDERRKKPSLHKVFGESISLLASYSLIAKGYELLSKKSDNPSRSLLAIHEASSLGGIRGAAGGQYLDLFPVDRSLAAHEIMVYRKTGALFETSFILGWILGGGDLSKLDDVRKCSFKLGKAFQIADDILDMEEDRKRKASNYALLLGAKEAKLMFRETVEGFEEDLRSLALLTPSFERFCSRFVEVT